MQRDQVSVPRHNVRRAATHGKFEEFIVLRIATCRNARIDFNPFRLERQCRQKAANIFFIDVSKEFFPSEDFIEFAERRKGKQHSSCQKCQFKRTTRL